MASLAPNAVFLNDLNYFMNKANNIFLIILQVPGIYPEFSFNLGINFTALIYHMAHRLIIRKFTIKLFLYITLIPQIFLIAIVPFVVENTHERICEGLTMAIILILGNLILSLLILDCLLGLYCAIIYNISVELGPQFISSYLS